MAIAARAVQAWATSTSTTATATIPSGTTTGDMMILFVGVKPYSGTYSINQGWTLLGEYANGTVANGSGVGSVDIAVFYKEHTGSESNPTITFGRTAAPAGYSMRSYSKAAGEVWETPVMGTVATTAVTSHSNTITTHVTVAAGDMALGFFFYRDDTTQTVPTFTQSGITYGTVAEYPSTALTTTTSNDIAADACHRLASSGTSTAAPVMTHTTSTTETGAYAFVRLRVVVATNAPAESATVSVVAHNPTKVLPPPPGLVYADGCTVTASALPVAYAGPLGTAPAQPGNALLAEVEDNEATDFDSTDRTFTFQKTLGDLIALWGTGANGLAIGDGTNWLSYSNNGWMPGWVYTPHRVGNTLVLVPSSGSSGELMWYDLLTSDFLNGSPNYSDLSGGAYPIAAITVSGAEVVVLTYTTVYGTPLLAWHGTEAQVRAGTMEGPFALPSTTSSVNSSSHEAFAAGAPGEVAVVLDPESTGAKHLAYSTDYGETWAEYAIDNNEGARLGRYFRDVYEGDPWYWQVSWNEIDGWTLVAYHALNGDRYWSFSSFQESYSSLVFTNPTISDQKGWDLRHVSKVNQAGIGIHKITRIGDMVWGTNNANWPDVYLPSGDWYQEPSNKMVEFDDTTWSFRPRNGPAVIPGTTERLAWGPKNGGKRTKRIKTTSPPGRVRAYNPTVSAEVSTSTNAYAECATVSVVADDAPFLRAKSSADTAAGVDSATDRGFGGVTWTAYTSQYPTQTMEDAQATVGMAFTVSENGHVAYSGRAWRGNATYMPDGGTLRMGLWGDGVLLASGSVVLPAFSVAGWVDVPLPQTPLSTEVSYVIAYLTFPGNVHYPFTYEGLSAGLDNGILHVPEGGGRKSYGSALTLPTGTTEDSYYADVHTRSLSGVEDSGAGTDALLTRDLWTTDVAVTSDSNQQATIFTSQTPQSTFADTPVTLGTAFTVNSSQFTGAARVYRKSATYLGNGETLQVGLWNAAGTMVASGSITLPTFTAAGWVEVPWDSSVWLTTGQTYTVGYFTDNGYDYTGTELSSPITNGSLSTVTTGGRYSYGTPLQRPTGEWTSNYYVDVVVESPAVLEVSLTDSDAGSAADMAAQRALADSDTGTAVDVGLLDGSTDKTDSDAATGVDVTTLLTTILTSADTGVGTEVPTVRALTSLDTATGADAATTRALTSTETAAGVDAVTARAATSVDTGSGADAVTVLGRAAADTATAVDAVTVLSVALTSPDTAAGAEAVTARTMTSGETGTGTDTSGVTGLVAAETGVGVDTVIARAIISTDTGAGTEAHGQTGLSSADTGAGADAVSARTLGSADTATSTDAVTVRTLTSADTAAGVDAFTDLTTADSKSASENGTAIDAATILTVTVSSTDTGSGSEAASLVVTLAGADTGTGTEATTSRALTSTETGAGTETVTARTVTSPEFGTGNEFEVVRAMTAADSATAVDAASLIVALASADTGSAADAVSSLVVMVSSTETGAGLDTVTARAMTSLDTGAGVDETGTRALAAAETATGADALTVRAITSTDTGAGVDAGALISAYSATDTGAGVETITARTMTSTEAGTGADASTLTGLSGTDTAVGTEAITARTMTSTEAGTGADASTLTGLAAADSAVGTEVVLTLSVARTDTDVGAATEVITVRGITTPDAGTGADTATTRELAAADTATGLDAYAALDAGSTNVATETGVAVDAATLSVSLTAAETGSGVDVGGIFVPVSSVDTASGDETVTARTMTSTEAGVGSDTDSRAATATETAAGADAATALSVTLTSTDLGSGVDAEALGVALSDSETGTGVEGPPTLVANLSGADTGSGIDAATTRALADTDIAQGAEQTLSRAITSADAATGIDSFTALDAGSGNIATDTGVGTEAAALAVTQTDTDTGTAVDAASLAVTLTGTEIGSGVDVITARDLSSIESGAGVESETVRSLTSSDSATAADTAALAVSLTAAETAIGVDTVTASTRDLSDVDTAAAADAATLSASLVGAGDSATHADAVIAREITTPDTAAGAEEYTDRTVTGVESGTGADVAQNPDTADSKNVTETGTAIEAASVAVTISSADTAIADDAASLSVVLIGVADTSIGDDAVTARAITSPDTADSTDTVTARAMTSDEVGSGVDQGALSVLLGSTDVAAVVDALIARAFDVADSGLGTEATTLNTDATKSGSETGDAVDAVIARGLETPEAGVGDDSSGLEVETSAMDAGAGTDAVTARSLVAADDATGEDTFATLDAGGENFAGDTATVTEAAMVEVILTSADTGAGIEATAIRALTSADTAGSLESATLSANLSLAEIASVAEAVTMRALTSGDLGTGFDYATPLTPPTGVWFEWTGTTEVPLSLEGEWTGSTVEPLTLDTVT